MSAVQDAITRAAQEEGIDPAFALAVADRESNFNPNARASSTIYGLFQMSRGLRAQYGSGDSNDPYTQAQGWSRFIGDTKNQLAARIGREPTNDELYLAHYFGEGRAAGMISGGIAPSTSVADVFTPQELAGNPNIGRAGTVGNLTSSISDDMERRQAKFGGAGEAPDFASFGVGGSPEQPTSTSGAPDFASFGQPQGGLTLKSTNAQPIDFSQFGTAARDQADPSGLLNAKSTPPAAQGAGGIENLGGVVDLTSKMAPNGIDTSGFRPSTNVEDDRNTSVLGKLANKFNAQMNGTWENPDAAGQDVDLSQFGLSGPAQPPPAAPIPQVPVTGL